MQAGPSRTSLPELLKSKEAIEQLDESAFTAEATAIALREASVLAVGVFRYDKLLADIQDWVWSGSTLILQEKTLAENRLKHLRNVAVLSAVQECSALLQLYSRYFWLLGCFLTCCFFSGAMIADSCLLVLIPVLVLACLALQIVSIPVLWLIEPARQILKKEL